MGSDLDPDCPPLALLAVFCRIKKGHPWLRSGIFHNLCVKNAATLDGKTRAKIHISCLRLRWNLVSIRKNETLVWVVKRGNVHFRRKNTYEMNKTRFT